MLYAITERRKHAAVMVAAADALDAKEGRASLVQDVRALSVIVQTMAFHSSDKALRKNLITALTESEVLCSHCPLLHSELCKECGRFASGEGHKNLGEPS